MVESAEQKYLRAYERYAPDVFRFALAWTNNWAAAEDLTQEAYLRLWQVRASIDWQRPVLGWLLVTTRHLAHDRWRALRRRLAPTNSEPAADELVRARWLDVRQALQRLTPLERTALLLTTVEGWSPSELADALETSDGALRSAVSRARQKLEVA